MKIKGSFTRADEENVKVMTDLVVNPDTPDPLKVKILQRFAEMKEDASFFDTILSDDLDFGECPHCGHANNWLIPEKELNQRGIVTSVRDPRVPNFTSEEICPEFHEACQKKKTGF
jgi:hypothetical protein